MLVVIRALIIHSFNIKQDVHLKGISKQAIPYKEQDTILDQENTNYFL